MSSARSPKGLPFRPKALVTGAAGFLGAAVLGHLAASGVDALGVDCREPRGAVPPGARFTRVDLLKPLELERAFQNAVPGMEGCAVFHLAAQTHVGKCRQDPSRAYAVNVTGTLNVLEACRALGILRVVYPSTALVYRRQGSHELDEDSPVGATSVYGATKLAAESILAGHAADYGFSCTVARIGNVFGPGGHADSVASILIRQARQGGPLSIRDASPVRDFIHRDDVCGGMLALASFHEAGFRILNLSSGTGTSIRELGLALCRAAGLPPGIRETDPANAGVPDRMVLSIARMEGLKPAEIPFCSEAQINE